MTIKQQGGIFGRNPTFNDVEVDGSLSGTTVDLVNSGGSTQTALTLTNNSTSFAAGSAISFKFDSDSQEYTQIEATPRNGSQGKLLVKNLLGGSLTQALTLDGVDLSVDAGNLVIGTSGKGIDFSATSGTGTSELFDDYEEGTWTPTYNTSGTQPSSITYDTAITGGKYTKVGKVCHCQAAIRTDAVTLGSASGELQIRGLPFTASTNSTGADGYSSIAVGRSLDFATKNPIGGVLEANTTVITLTKKDTADGNSANMNFGNLATGTNDNYIFFTISYVTA